MSGPDPDRRARLLLLAGVVAGIALAAVGLVQDGAPGAALPEHAVAVVNGQVISEEAFATLEEALERERRGEPLSPEARARMLERLVDEELLLQQGLALGLARHDPIARRAIVSAVVAAVTSDVDAEEPDEEALRAFFAAEGDRFRRPARLSLDAVFVGVEARPETEAFQRAREAAERLRAGEDVAAVEESLGDPQRAPLPQGPVPPELVRRYLGPSALHALARLAPGEVSEPVRGGAGYYVLRLRERVPGELPPFEEVGEQVRGELLRAQGDRALADRLEALREAAELEVRLPPPATSDPARPAPGGTAADARDATGGGAGR